MSAAEQLVSVGIPTYNRAEHLERAVRSVLCQSHVNLEVIVSDNGSTDETPRLLEKLANEDTRLQVIRRDVNRGPTDNFNAVRAHATGEFFMWLGDDDWIDPDYVGSCLARLHADPRLTLAAGRVRYHGSGGDQWDGRRVEPVAASAQARLLAFYREVKDNGTFYGLVPRRFHERIPPMVNAMGNDLQHVAALAFLGPFSIVDSTCVHRATGGATASLKRAARSAGMPWWQGELPPLAIAWLAFRDIGARSSVYSGLGTGRRQWLALQCAAILLVRFVPQAVPKYLRLLSERLTSVFRRLRSN